MTMGVQICFEKSCFQLLYINFLKWDCWIIKQPFLLFGNFNIVFHSICTSLYSNRILQYFLFPEYLECTSYWEKETVHGGFCLLFPEEPYWVSFRISILVICRASLGKCLFDIFYLFLYQVIHFYYLLDPWFEWE